MTATTSRQTGAFTGTGILLRFMLRRDRWRLPAWVLGLTLLMVYFSTALGTVLDEASLAGMAQLARSPVTALVGGPGYGFDAITVPRFLAGLYGTYLMLGAAFMSMLTISRHTRAEEQSGRAELVLAGAVGRHAQPTAALVLAVFMNLLMALLMTGVVLTAPLDPAPEPAPTILFTASIAAVGIAFAGVSTATAQLSPFSRTCTGLAGTVLAVSFIVRGLGDMSRVQDGRLAWLSWLSPIGWAQQTAPYTLDRWWPLLLPLLFAGFTAGLGFRLRSRRDLGAGVVADRPGNDRAPTWLGSPLALAWRLQRGTLIGWSGAFLVAGLVFGAFTQTITDTAGDMPPEILAVMGGATAITEGYLGFMGIYFAVMLSVYGILAVTSLRGEETSYRSEPVLAAAVGRVGWVLSWVAVAAAGALWLSVLAGIAEGLGAVLVTADWSLFLPTVLGHGVQFAPVWLFIGLAAAFYGLVPRLVGLVWLVFIAGSVLSMFGRMLQLSQTWLNLSPFEHVGQHPATEVAWAGVGLLAGGGVILALLGALAFRRRDLTAV
ncbi:ABC transporter permease [Corynebacterium marinum]|uniref:ABC transporter permease n=1 Tax=Corynebacterium marinum DSM 44953 TaxID=1224162 RepID=A0A0B6TTS7_9CORY|nr:ABC transporter permease [Corynebacterium marinum]AJK69669.1 ABC transporter permease [Corynebacterium marinum DSM 44953]GGO18152.1 exporter of polyketide antibiotics [Corynebacterium marinum]